MHELLRRQLAKQAIDARRLDAPYRRLLEVVDATYSSFDSRGRQLKRSFISQKRQLRAASKERQAASDLLDRTIHLAANGILVVDEEGKVLHYNHKFRDMWRLTDRLLTEPAALSERHQQVANQLADPDQFYRTVRQLRGSDEESFDILNLLDGRVIERTSKPLLGLKGIQGRVWSYYDVTERHTHEEQLRRLASLDPLTGLANRTHFMNSLASVMADSQRADEQRFVLFLDLDDFKQINDALGHAAGDRALTAVAKRISSALDAGDMAARVGGDEFGVLLKDAASQAQASLGAEAILLALQQPIVLEDNEIVPSACIGIASTDHCSRPEEVMRDADIALYIAKAQGRGSVKCYESGMPNQIRARPQPRSEQGHDLAGSELPDERTA